MSAIIWTIKSAKAVSRAADIMMNVVNVMLVIGAVLQAMESTMALMNLEFWNAFVYYVTAVGLGFLATT